MEDYKFIKLDDNKNIYTRCEKINDDWIPSKKEVDTECSKTYVDDFGNSHRLTGIFKIEVFKKYYLIYSYTGGYDKNNNPRYNSFTICNKESIKIINEYAKI